MAALTSMLIAGAAAGGLFGGKKIAENKIKKQMEQQAAQAPGPTPVQQQQAEVAKGPDPVTQELERQTIAGMAATMRIRGRGRSSASTPFQGPTPRGRSMVATPARVSASNRGRY